MKKMVWMVLFSILLMAFGPFSILVLADEELAPLWDGTAANGFAGGDGTKSNPFRIESAEQFAYFRDRVHGGDRMREQYVKLCADIRFNDERFTFDPDSGLVKVTNGSHTAYYGTGYKGDDSGDHTFFDTEPSTLHSWYNDKGEVIENYPGTLLSWTPIGTSNSGTTNQYFNGYFDGAGHTIDGMFVSEPKVHVGLFANVPRGALENIHITNCLVSGNVSVGSVVGRVGYIDMKSCTASGVVIGENEVGGLIGGAELKSNVFSHLENECTVIGNQNVGGIAGMRNTSIQYSLNKGDVYGGKRVGGIVGNSTADVIRRCTNLGTIRGQSLTGGIAGEMSVSASDCHNSGRIIGEYCTGGIAGKLHIGPMQDCLNTAEVLGESHVGGIVGYGQVTQAQNSGNVWGIHYVGGICGYGDAEGTINYGQVTGSTQVGGIVGMGLANQSQNHGKIVGNDNVGGVCGRYLAVTRFSNFYCQFNNCYNTGSVTADHAVGGIVGRMDSQLVVNKLEYPLNLLSVYNVGNVQGKSYVGAIVGRLEGDDPQIMAYYLENTAVDANQVVQSGIGSENSSLPSKDIADRVRGCSALLMSQQQTYLEFDFETIWEFSNVNNRPMLKVTEKIQHDKLEKNSEFYLHQRQSCLEPIMYHVACTCGAMLDELFVANDDKAHTYSRTWSHSASSHWNECTECGVHSKEALHVFEKIGVVQATENENEYEVLMYCPTCEFEMRLPFEYAGQLQIPQADGEQPPIQTPSEVPKAAQPKVDLRSVLLLLAGVALGVLGGYGASVIKRTRREVKKKKSRSKNFI